MGDHAIAWVHYLNDNSLKQLKSINFLDNKTNTFLSHQKVMTNYRNWLRSLQNTRVQLPGWEIYLSLASHPGQLSLAIPLWVGVTVKYTGICIVRLLKRLRSDMDHTVLSANNTISAFTLSLRPSPPFLRYSLRLPLVGWPGWVDLGSWLDWDKFPAPRVEPRYGHPSRY